MFFRLNKDGLADLLGLEKNLESVYNLGDDKHDAQSLNTQQTSKTITTTKTDQNFKLEVTEKTDFALVDLRDEPEFEKYRIVDGRP